MSQYGLAVKSDSSSDNSHHILQRSIPYTILRGRIIRAVQTLLVIIFALFFSLDLILNAAKGIGWLMGPFNLSAEKWELFVLWPPACAWIVILAGFFLLAISFWGIPHWFNSSLSFLASHPAESKIKKRTGRVFSHLTPKNRWRIFFGLYAAGVACVWRIFFTLMPAYSSYSIIIAATLAIPLWYALFSKLGELVGKVIRWLHVKTKHITLKKRVKTLGIGLVAGGMCFGICWVLEKIAFSSVFPLVMLVWALVMAVCLILYRSREYKSNPLHITATRVRKWRNFLLRSGIFLGIFLVALNLFPKNPLSAFTAGVIGLILDKPRQSVVALRKIGYVTMVVLKGIAWPITRLYSVILKYPRIYKALGKLATIAIRAGGVFTIFLVVMWAAGGVFIPSSGFTCLGTAIAILAVAILLRMMPLLVKRFPIAIKGTEFDEEPSSGGYSFCSKYPKWVDHPREKEPSLLAEDLHRSRKVSKKTIFQTMALGFAILCLFGGQMLGSLPGWNFDGANTSAPTGTSEWLYLTHDEIMANEELVFPFYANNYSYIVTKVSGTRFVNFTLGDNVVEPKMYIATEGWSWWSVKFEAKDWGSNPEHIDENWFNITVDGNLRQYIDALAVQPYILADGEESIGESEEARTINFHGIGAISILLWANARFVDLYVELDGEVLKPDVSDDPDWNEANWSTAVLAPWLQGGTALVFTVDCDTSDHVLKLGGWGNLTYAVCTEYDVDGDDLSDSLELQHLLDWGVLPNYPDIWGKMTSVIEEVNYSINDFLLMSDELLTESPKYRRNNLEFYIPSAYNDRPNHFFIDAYGEYTQFEIDGDAGITMENVTLYGFYSNNPEITTLTDQEGNQHTLPINQFAARDTYYAGDLSPGWHKVVFLERVLPFSSAYIKFRINDYNVIITEGNEIEDPEGDFDGDFVPNTADFSPSQYLTWEAGTIFQIVIPVDSTGAQEEDPNTNIEMDNDAWEALPDKGYHAAEEDVEVKFQVVRPSYDISTSEPIIWHEGEEGALKCHIIPALRLFSKGDPASLDYLYKDESFCSFWGEEGAPRKIETYNLVDVNAFGETYNPTGDLELLPEKGASDLYFSFVFPSIATDVWEFSIKYPHDHPNLQDGCLSQFFDFCWVVVKENWENSSTDILQVYDFDCASSEPQTLNISGIQKRTFSNVNGLVGAPNDHVSLRALQAFNQNPVLCPTTGGGGGGGGPYPAGISGGINDAILYNFIGTHYMEAYNYNDENPDTWSVSERFARGALNTQVSHCQVLYTFDPPASANLDYWGSASTTSTSTFRYYVADGTLHLRDEDDLEQITLWREFNETIEETVSVSWDFMIESSTSIYSSIWMGLANNGVDLITLRMDGNLLYFQNNYVMSGGWATDTWHTARITFNNRTREGRLLVDGYVIGTCSLPISAGGATEFIVHDAGSSTYKLRAQIDDVKIEWDHKTYTPKWSGKNHVEFLSVSQSYMDVLQKIFIGSKFDVAEDEEYVQYPGTLNFNSAPDGTALDSLGWTVTSGLAGYLAASVVRNIGTHANVAHLLPMGVPPENNWARASKILGPSTEVDFADFWLAIGSSESVFSICLDNGVSGTGIVLEYRGGNFYYKGSDSEWVKICNLWAGAWFHCRVDYNCSDGHFNIYIGGSTEGLRASCSFFTLISGISRITFNTNGGDGFFHSIGRSSDAGYSGNNLPFDTIKSGDLTERLSVCEIFDSWNGTYSSDSDQLHLDNEILFQVKASDMIYEHKRATFNRFPVAIDLTYANDDYSDGYSVMNRLAITYAEGDMDTKHEFPLTTGTYAPPISYYFCQLRLILLSRKKPLPPPVVPRLLRHHQKLQ